MNGTNGVAKSHKKALEWIRVSADAGDCGGLNNLGLLYMNGRGDIKRDLVKAAKYTLAAAEKGNYPAMLNTSQNYMHGRGVAKCSVKAEHWTQLAAAYDFAGDEGLQAEAGLPPHASKRIVH
jgi:hypothetical protein